LITSDAQIDQIDQIGPTERLAPSS